MGVGRPNEGTPESEGSSVLRSKALYLLAFPHLPEEWRVDKGAADRVPRTKLDPVRHVIRTDRVVEVEAVVRVKPPAVLIPSHLPEASTSNRTSRFRVIVINPRARRETRNVLGLGLESNERIDATETPIEENPAERTTSSSFKAKVATPSASCRSNHV